jgi:hypothetical protein
MKKKLVIVKAQGDKDELYQQALEIIRSEGKAQHLFYKENFKLDTIEQQELLI